MQDPIPAAPPSWLERHLGAILIAIGGLGLGAVAVALAVFAGWFHAHEVSTHPTDWATFGDYFGGALTPLLTFLGLIAVLLTLWVQNHELALTRAEMARTRQSAEESARAQARAAELQEINLILATARMRILAHESEISVIEMESHSTTEKSRHAQNIKAVAERMHKLTTQMEEVLGRHVPVDQITQK